MYKIETKPYGLFIVFDEVISADEMTQWVAEFKKSLVGQNTGFGVMVDMRTMKPLAPEAGKLLESGQKEAKARGMGRSAVVLNSAVVAMQLKRVAQDTGIYQWERYINASQDANWQKTAEDWLSKGTDPDA